MSTSSWSLTPREHDRLARRTAEMLALPEMVCDKRLCRRTHVCEFFDNKSGKRWCLRRLDPEARAAWDELHAIVIKIADLVHLREPARDPRRRELEEAAIEIVSAVPLHDPVCHLFRLWLKAYRAAASEETDGRNPHRPTLPAPAAPEIRADDEVLNLRESESGQFVVPDHADLDDWRNYK
ncbi:hypothetical protein IHQ71_27025 [Rhizobium sp. TH2]|uniref:hypothetical protein n=1 Tax=Rhizobium sp. TH2 TaxID=2775403 RepID=UPI002157029F|nr:hypothetical protein [Rhizobium sp. TH2]UVC08736.1 hypothetical protein IHQ71_27025 [Rhizobium sp. TH2]